MKTLKESILSSTNTGKVGKLAEVKEWFENTEDYKNIFRNSMTSIEVSIVGKKYKINIKSRLINYTKNNHFVFSFCEKDNDGKTMKYPIHSVSFNDSICDIDYIGLTFKDSSEFVEEVGTIVGKISFHGCDIDVIDSLPKNCNIINFYPYHKIGGTKETVVKKIKNIKLDSITTNVYHGGIKCMLPSIENITINKIMYITDTMVGRFALENSKNNKTTKRIFTDVVGNEFNEFFKNNNVKPEDCYFCPLEQKSRSKIGRIRYNKIIDKWEYNETNMTLY
jgi:hypothetical protein